MSDMPFVSIIIPVLNDNKRLDACLRALNSQNYDGKYEIVVCDNGSDIVPQISGRARLVTESAPGSYAARNKGIAASLGDVLAFTDSDCIPDAGWLQNGVLALIADDRIGLVGGRIQVFAKGADPTFVERVEMAVAFPQELYVTNGSYAATANMLTKRLVIESVGPFAAHLFSGGDADWGRRVAAAGFNSCYAEGAVVNHPARSTHGEIFRKLRRTVGGERDARSSWKHTLRFAARHALPPRHQISLIFKNKDLSLLRQVQVTFYCVLLNWSAGAYRLYLQICKSASSSM